MIRSFTRIRRPWLLLTLAAASVVVIASSPAGASPPVTASATIRPPPSSLVLVTRCHGPGTGSSGISVTDTSGVAHRVYACDVVADAVTDTEAIASKQIYAEQLANQLRLPIDRALEALDARGEQIPAQLPDAVHPAGRGAGWWSGRWHRREGAVPGKYRRKLK